MSFLAFKTSRKK